MDMESRKNGRDKRIRKNRIIKKHLILMLGVFVVFLTGGCRQKEELPFLAFSVYEQKTARMAALIGDVLSMAREDGYSIEWRSGDGSIEKQKADIRELIGRKPEYLIVVPIQTLGLGEVLEEAREQGIKIIFLDGMVDQEKFKDYLTVIRPDARWEGEECAKLLGAYFGGTEAKILEIQGIAGNSQAQLRSVGFRNQLCEYPNLELTGAVQGDFDRVTAGSNLQNFVEKSGSFDGIFCSSDEEGIGVLSVIGTAKGTEVCPIVSVNGQQDVKKALMAGYYLGSVESSPYLGQELSSIIRRDMAGEEVEKETLLRGVMYTEENAKEMQGY